MSVELTGASIDFQGETCKAVIYLEIAASRNKFDIKALAIQFGCVRLIPFVHRGLSLYKDRFLASLPPSRRSSTDFSRPVFTAVAFYLGVDENELYCCVTNKTYVGLLEQKLL
ncbi:hypothetical protein ACS0TY_009880 [Phlomoides rotata]